MPNPVVIGQCRVMVEIAVDAQEISNWSPERIAAFFDGIAQAMRARKGEITEVKRRV